MLKRGLARENRTKLTPNGFLKKTIYFPIFVVTTRWENLLTYLTIKLRRNSLSSESTVEKIQRVYIIFESMKIKILSELFRFSSQKITIKTIKVIVCYD